MQCEDVLFIRKMLIRLLKIQNEHLPIKSCEHTDYNYGKIKHFNGFTYKKSVFTLSLQNQNNFNGFSSQKKKCHTTVTWNIKIQNQFCVVFFFVFSKLFWGAKHVTIRSIPN